MHGPINVKSPNNTSKWQMGFNSAFKGLNNQTCENATYRCENLHVKWGGGAGRMQTEDI
jgi:hypothetical protein